MTIPFTLPVLLSGAIIAQGIFAAFVLTFHQRNQIANRFLALLLLSFLLWLMDSFFKVGTVYQQNPNFYFLPIFYSLAFGPLIYYYVKLLTNPDYQLKSKDLLHLIPVLLQGILYLFLQFQTYDFRRWFWFEVHRPITYDLEYDLTLLSLFTYLLLSLRLLRDYQNWVENNFSEISKIHLQWLKILLTFMGLLCLLWGVDVFLRTALDIYNTHNFSEIIMGIAVLLLAFGSIQQNNLTNIEFRDPNPVSKTPPPPIEELDKGLLQKIQHAMEIEKAYLHPTLTLKDFAAFLQYPPRKISTHINQGLQMSFVDFVNQHRIAEVKRQIKAGALNQFTLLAIALESGFNSKSTFNRAFKKHTGKSPSEYLREVGSRK